MSSRIRRDLVRRGALLWLGARVFVTVAIASTASGLPSEVRGEMGMSPLGASAAIGVSMLAFALSYVDVRVCNETLMFANLGISRTQIALFVLAVSGVIESAVLVASFAMGQ